MLLVRNSKQAGAINLVSCEKVADVQMEMKKYQRDTLPKHCQQHRHQRLTSQTEPEDEMCLPEDFVCRLACCLFGKINQVIVQLYKNKK